MMPIANFVSKEQIRSLSIFKILEKQYPSGKYFDYGGHYFLLLGNGIAVITKNEDSISIEKKYKKAGTFGPLEDAKNKALDAILAPNTN